MSETLKREKRHFLTNDDRDFLTGRKVVRKEKSDHANVITEGTAQNARRRVRTRLRCALEDIQLLSTSFGTWNAEHFVRGVSEDPDDEKYQLLRSLAGFVYTLARVSGVDEEMLFEDAIRNVGGPFVKDVNVGIDIEHKKPYGPNVVRGKVERGELPTAWETGMVVMHGDGEVPTTFCEEEKPLLEWIQTLAEKREVGEDYVGVY